MIDFDINDPLEVRLAGLAVLTKALGLDGMVKFMRGMEPPSGDYTAEKYNQPEPPVEEILAKLRQYAAQA